MYSDPWARLGKVANFGMTVTTSGGRFSGRRSDVFVQHEWSLVPGNYASTHVRKLCIACGASEVGPVDFVYSANEIRTVSCRDALAEEVMET